MAHLLIFLAIGITVLVVWILTIGRTAVNNRLSMSRKGVWILGQVFLPPLSFIYLCVEEKSPRWRIFGASLILLTTVSILFPRTQGLPVLSQARSTAVESRITSEQERIQKIQDKQPFMEKLPYQKALNTLTLLNTSMASRLSDADVMSLLDSLDSKVDAGNLSNDEIVAWERVVGAKMSAE
jgi:hypothetical protein